MTYTEQIAADIAIIRSLLNEIEDAARNGVIDNVHEIASEIADIALSITDITETN